MCRLIKLTDAGGETFYLNADKVVTVHPVEDSMNGVKAIVHHEPYNRENALDWMNVKETPEEIAGMCTTPAMVIHIPAEDYR